MFDAIERVVYINLDERVDRKSQIQRELLSVFPAHKITRFSAIRNAVGGIGCSMSHIAVLELAKKEGWSNVLIVEDDFMWTPNQGQGAPVLEKLLSRKFDVIVLSGTYVDYNKETYRLNSCQTTTAYAVSDRYYDTLLANFKEGVSLLESTKEYKVYALDQFWKRLQPVGLWYFVCPMMGIQRPGYSDIEKRVVNYSQYFGFVR
jgi:glycosyl transferase family 25